MGQPSNLRGLLHELVQPRQAYPDVAARLVVSSSPLRCSLQSLAFYGQGLQARLDGALVGLQVFGQAA